MPQIKFSGLVSDMKGKLGGSVLSSNKQGAYMRQNKWGGGRKSNRWDRSKARLSQLANSWRALTLGQQEAWNNAAGDFPFTNKFNQEYIASGYQVYMSLNGTLLANNLPLLTAPGANRPFPEDLVVEFRQEQPPWVTTGTGATFPNILASTGGCLQSGVPCPMCYTCSGGVCIPKLPITSAEWQDCIKQFKGHFQAFEPVGCTTDQDCVDEGLIGAGGDTACVDGECTYVGDGFLNWANFGYVLNITNALRNSGEWSQGNHVGQNFLAGSFRFTLGTESLRILRSGVRDIVLVSNYYADGRGGNIRIRPQDQETIRLQFTMGLTSTDTASGYITYTWYIDLQLAEISSNSVFQYQLDLDDVTNTKFAINNFGWVTPQFTWYDELLLPSSPDWSIAEGDVSNLPEDWRTIEKSWGLVYGAGMYGYMTDIVYTDIRNFKSRYESFLDPLVGYLNGEEDILILANGPAKPKCNYAPCNPDLVGICKPEDSCTCKHNICGLWGQRETWHSNKAPDGDPNIYLAPSVPVFAFDTPSDPYSTATFAEQWMILDGGLYGTTGATYVPNVKMNVTAPSESGFALMLFAQNPIGYNGNNRWKADVYMVTIDASTSGTYNLWEYLKLAIKNAPAGTSFDISYAQVDTQSGLAHPRRRVKDVRFKAGAELSSAVY